MKTTSFAGKPALPLIVLVYLVIGVLYAIKTPDWQVPDEPAHYNYVRQVATNGCCPTIQTGDWDSKYLDTIKAAKFSPASLGNNLPTIQYEDHQPPLFYLLEAPVYSASNGNLHAMRIISVLFGAGIVIAAWAAVQIVFPVQPWLALATAAFVAFLPQHIAMMAGVENDSLAELIVGLILVVTVLYLGNGHRRVHPALLGILLGVTFLTKLTAMLPMIVVVGAVVLLCALRDRWNLPKLAREFAWVAVPALIMGVPWWVHNLQTYGGLDFLAQNAHDRVVVGQLTTSQYIDGYTENKIHHEGHGVAAWLQDSIQTTFQSFWGKFGWMGVPLSDPMYSALLAFTILVIVGAGIAFFRWRLALSPPQRDALVIFGLTAFLAFVETAGYNLKFVQFQGRYLYAGLIPIALFVAIGLAGWASLLRTRIAYWATAGIICLFAIFDVYLLFRVIIPQLT